MHPYRGWPFLSDPHYPGLSAVWAVLAHGIISIIVVLPIVFRLERRGLFVGVAFIAGSALDLDHVVAAGSFSPRALEHLGHRPETHSVGFAVATSLITFAFTRRILVAWSVFAVFVAHLLFDAAGGGVYWLYPLEQTDGIPWLAAPFGLLLLTIVSMVLAQTQSESTAVGLAASEAGAPPEPRSA